MTSQSRELEAFVDALRDFLGLAPLRGDPRRTPVQRFAFQERLPDELELDRRAGLGPTS